MQHVLVETQGSSRPRSGTPQPRRPRVGAGSRSTPCTTRCPTAGATPTPSRGRDAATRSPTGTPRLSTAPRLWQPLVPLGERADRAHRFEALPGPLGPHQLDRSAEAVCVDQPHRAAAMDVRHHSARAARLDPRWRLHEHPQNRSPSTFGSATRRRANPAIPRSPSHREQ